MAPLTLYVSPGTCSLFVHILFRESKLPFELEIVDITKTYGFPDTLKHLNPKKRFPLLVLEDGKTVLTETVGIASYIDRRAPEAQIFGKSALDVGRCFEWFNWLSGTVHERGFGALFMPFCYTDDEAAQNGVRIKSRKWIRECFGMIEERLKDGKGFSVGDGFTAADVFLYVEYRWGYLIGIDMKKEYPAYTKLVDQVVERESVKEAVKVEGIEMIIDNRSTEWIRSLGVET
ncbi:hypothetical protein KVT40_000665 [Elsinoe batatas]|uniref:Glutathione S-transferase n=1 Tax=Elsinoe batatas TaxID=2601811 RepID=A0A8K0LCG5_9PEZI|nr:hypothetical protein KVT40_000665 [Elsinoe batatas]